MSPIILGLAGLLGTWALKSFLRGRISAWGPHHAWFLGIAALFPSWLFLFLGMIQAPTPETADVPLPPRAILSSGTALLGIIATEYLVRRSQKSESFGDATSWILGVVALVPAMFIALAGP